MSLLRLNAITVTAFLKQTELNTGLEYIRTGYSTHAIAPIVCNRATNREKVRTVTNRERMLQNASNCPYRDNDPPISAKSFCAEGCSVTCRQEMIAKLEKSSKGIKWLEREDSG